jgi:hypothetical protein
MTKQDLIALVERLPDEAVAEAIRRLDTLLPSKEPLAEDDWRLLDGMCAGGESLTRWLEEEKAREREQESRKYDW